MTVSPAFRPSSTTQSSPTQLPTLIWRWAALPSAPTIQTKRPPSFCITALCGTTSACWVPATTCTRTYCPGSSCSLGLGSSARICTVPRLESTLELEKFSLPASG